MTSDPVAARPDDEDLATAVGLYALGEISHGKAAERVEMDRWEFEELVNPVVTSRLSSPLADRALTLRALDLQRN